MADSSDGSSSLYSDAEASAGNRMINMTNKNSNIKL